MGVDIISFRCFSLLVWCKPPNSFKNKGLSDSRGNRCCFSRVYNIYIEPLERVEIPPFDGQDLNPLLQDPGLAFHPPFLYLGYVGLSMAFSLQSLH